MASIFRSAHPRSAVIRLCLGLIFLLTACTPGAASQPGTLPSATLAPTAAPSVTPQPSPTPAEPSFDGQRAYQDVEYQVSLGPRTPGSEAHAQAVDWMQQELQASGWEVEVQETTMLDHPVRNVIAKRGAGQPWIIIGAHYDSRMKADRDPDPARHDDPVPAANDGASGVAVLLELARGLPREINGQVWLTFFDTEDQGQLEGWDWILGSRAVANSLTGKPDAVVVVDMIGDADLNIYREKNSDQPYTDEIWQAAAELGYAEQFINEPKFSMLDDHTPFLEKGIRAVDIIDFDYPAWHTTGDTADKVSAESLQAVGDTVLHWVMGKVE